MAKHKLLSERKRKIIRDLIPAAMREADEHARVHGKDTWAAAYHEAMDRMAREEGVRV